MWERRRSGLYTRRREQFNLQYLAAIGGAISAATAVTVRVPCGLPDPSREIFALITPRDSVSARTITAIDINGVAGTVEVFNPASVATHNLVRFQLPQPWTQGVMNITLSAAATGFLMIYMFRSTGRAAYGLGSSDSGTQNTAASSATQNVTTLKPRGFLLGLQYKNNTETYNSVTGCDVAEFTPTPGGVAGVSLAAIWRRPQVQDVGSTPTTTLSWTTLASPVHLATWALDFAT